jgi:hypothetical protein
LFGQGDFLRPLLLQLRRPVFGWLGFPHLDIVETRELPVVDKYLPRLFDLQPLILKATRCLIVHLRDHLGAMYCHKGVMPYGCAASVAARRDVQTYLKAEVRA